MTSDFRQRAYEAVRTAEAVGVRKGDVIVFEAPPGRWQFPLAALKRLLHEDRLRRRPRA